MQDVPHELSVAIVVLAAGLGTRMGGSISKLLAQLDGVPLVKRSALAALQARASSVTVVVGHQQDQIRTALNELPLVIIENPAFAEGMATSLSVGLGVSQVSHSDGALIMLADMPLVSSADIDRLMSAFRQAGGRAVVRASMAGKRGNPVILPQTLFEEARLLTGDTGARKLIEKSGLPIIDVDIGEAAHADIDTLHALIAMGGRLPEPSS